MLCRCFYYGDYSGVDEAFLVLGREVRERGLKPAGFVRVLGIVAPYSGHRRSRHSGIAPASSCRWRNKTLAIQPFLRWNQ